MHSNSQATEAPEVPYGVTREERRHMNGVRFWFGSAPKQGEWRLVTRMLEKYERSLSQYERRLGLQWGGEQPADRPDLEVIMARASTASSGPWKQDRDENMGENWLIASLGNGVIVTTDHVHASEVGGSVSDDAAFISAARVDVPALVRYAWRLEAEIAELRSLPAGRAANSGEPEQR